LNRLLTLMVLARLHVDNVGDYSADIRQHLEASLTRPDRTYRQIYDRRPLLGEDRFSSLLSMPAQLAMNEGRKRRLRGRELRGMAPTTRA
jgi:hypothetical protein